MATSFSRTLRSLQADRLRGAQSAILFGIIGLVGWGIWFGLARVSLYEVSAQARLEVDREPYAIMSPVSGRVVRASLVLGREVREGDILIELDGEEIRYQLEEKRAQGEGMKAQLERLGREIEAQTVALAEERKAEGSAVEEVRARYQEAVESARFAEQEAERAESLDREGLVSRAQAEARQTEARQKRRSVEALSRSLERLEGDRRAAQSEKRAELEALGRSAAELEAAVAALPAVEKRLAHLLSLHVIRSPVAGRIGDVVSLKVGGVLSSGAHLGTVIPSGEIRVVAAFAPSRALGRLQTGQRAKLRLEGFSWVEYGIVACTVQRVAREPQDGTVRVELSLDDPHSFPVALDHGLPGTLEVEVERVSPAALVLRAAGGAASRPVDSRAP